MTEKKTLSLKLKQKTVIPTGQVGVKTPLRKPLLKKKRRVIVNTAKTLSKAKFKRKFKKPFKKKKLARNPSNVKLRYPPKVKIIQAKKIPPSEIKAQQLDSLLHQRYPAWHNYEPLQLGIEKQLFQLISAEHLPYSKRVVQRVLKRHTHCRQYLNSVLHSARRVSLKNTIVSDVIDTEKEYAKSRLDQ